MRSTYAERLQLVTGEVSIGMPVQSLVRLQSERHPSRCFGSDSTPIAIAPFERDTKMAQVRVDPGILDELHSE